MPRSEWRYPPSAPKFGRPTECVAWIAGSGSPFRSAAAWRVAPIDLQDVPVEDVKLSLKESTAPRAELAALIGALETLSIGSLLLCHTRSQYAKTAGERVAQWKAQGWEGNDGPVANIDILVRLEEILRLRQLTLRFSIVDRSKSFDSETVERLAKRARGEVRDAT